MGLHGVDFVLPFSECVVYMALSLPDALVLLGRWLQETGYRFTAITPASHARVNARSGAGAARSLRDVFGWSRPFVPGLLPRNALDWLRSGGLVEESGGLLRSRVRFASLGRVLYAHSAYPTVEAEAVFFGPDTYRFAALIEAELQSRPLGPGARILDIGCGAGPGGMTAALACPAAQPELLLADINPRALEFARANAALAGLAGTSLQQSNLFESLEGRFELIVANPPYLVDAGERTYRHGGGPLGSGLSLRIVQPDAAGARWPADAVHRRAHRRGPRPLPERGGAMLERAGCPFSYCEIDPDVFGEELDAPAYADTERIAAVALVAAAPGSTGLDSADAAGRSTPTGNSATNL